jgi:8-oxo-dGTP diphosphatase
VSIDIRTASGGRAGEATWLRGYRPADFPPFTLTVDLAILTIRDGQLCALLVKRGEHPYRGWWALPGGHVHHGEESADQAAVRELREETGLDAGTAGIHLEQLRTYADPRRDPRIAVGLHVASAAYVALTPDLPEPEGASDAEAARWWPVADLDLTRQRAAWVSGTDYDGDAVALAFDHAVILDDSIARAQAKLEYTTLAAGFVPEPFTLAELRRVYEAVWGSAPDLANFRRKVLSVPGFVVPIEETRRPSGDGVGRPSLLYRRGPATEMSPPMTRSLPRTGR